MKIWNHYFFYFIKTVFAVLCLILFVYYIITYLENLLYYFNSHPADTKTKFLYYFWQLPNLTVQILPFAVLISGIIVHWSLAKTREITALRSAGKSLLSISFPFICGAIFYGMIHFSLSEFVRPNTYKKYAFIKYVAIEKKPDQNLFEKTNWLKSKNGILHFGKYSESQKTLENPEYFFFDDNYTHLKFIVRSPNATFDSNEKKWVMQNVEYLDFSNTDLRTSKHLKKFITDIDFTPPKLLKNIVNSDEISFFKLRKLIHSANQAGVQISDRLFDLYLKTSLPFSSIIFLLFTIPFATQSERKESSYLNILLCMMLTCGYWFGNLALKKLTILGVLPPLAGAWSLNFVFGILVLFIIAKQEKPA